MITRKIAKQVMEQWERDKQQYGVVVVKTFIEQFTDELTPDEMLDEIIKKLKEKLQYITISEFGENVIFQIKELDNYEPLKIIERKTRTEAITEAYRQFKEATQ